MLIVIVTFRTVIPKLKKNFYIDDEVNLGKSYFST